MNTEMKFKRTAQRRKHFAFWLAVLLHLALFAAIAYQHDLSGLLPDFVKEYFEKGKKQMPTALVEQPGSDYLNC